MTREDGWAGAQPLIDSQIYSSIDSFPHSLTHSFIYPYVCTCIYLHTHTYKCIYVCTLCKYEQYVQNVSMYLKYVCRYVCVNYVTSVKMQDQLIPSCMACTDGLHLIGCERADTLPYTHKHTLPEKLLVCGRVSAPTFGST